MGDRYREPRALSPERLSLKSIESVKNEDSMVELTATFLFDPWSPDWEGELSRAVSVLTQVVADAASKAAKKRERKSAEQYADLPVEGIS
jgi:hypothetical protein